MENSVDRREGTRGEPLVVQLVPADNDDHYDDDFDNEKIMMMVIKMIIMMMIIIMMMMTKDHVDCREGTWRKYLVVQLCIHVGYDNHDDDDDNINDDDDYDNVVDDDLVALANMI